MQAMQMQNQQAPQLMVEGASFGATFVRHTHICLSGVNPALSASRLFAVVRQGARRRFFSWARAVLFVR